MHDHAGPTRADADATEPLTVQSAERLLEELILSDELRELEEKLGGFNLFDALRITRVEIRHSNALAWLLNPGETHGQGDLFLKAVVMDLLRRTPRDKRPIGPVALDGRDLANVRVFRERSRIDLLVVSDDPKFVVVIEQKVDAGEHGEQLNRYEQAVARDFPSHPALFVFLAPDDREASDADWTGYSYASLHDALSRAREQARGSLGDSVGVFVDHYLNTIRNELMENTEIVSLCQQIYAQHRRALDLIFEHRPTSPAEGLETVLRTITEAGTWRRIGSSRPFLNYIHTKWIGSAMDSEGKPLAGVPCSLWFECQSSSTKDGHRLKSRIRIGPGIDAAMRRKVIEELRNAHGIAAPSRITNMWTSLQTRTIASWDADDEIPEETIQQALLKWIADLAPAIDAIPDILRKHRVG